jgi:hypothetical protein
MAKPEQNPYAPPSARVAGADVGGDAGHPSEWQRAKWVFGALCLLLAVLTVPKVMLHTAAEPDWAVLLINCVAATSVGAFVARDMWLLKSRLAPLIVDIAIYVIGLGGLFSLFFLRETGLFVWNPLHLEIPAVLTFGIIAAVAWLTESRKRVRIYVGARQLVFVKADADF